MDIIGKTFGDMEVLKLDSINKNYIKTYLVKCKKCGAIRKIQLTRLKKIESCCFHNNKYCSNYIEEYDKYLNIEVNDYRIIKFLYIKNGNPYYLAKCKICGTTFVTNIFNFLKEYGTKHINCSRHLPKNKYLKRFKKIYSCMRYRTTNSNYTEFYLYGGRGISSEYYKDFIIFYNDMFSSYIEHVEKYGENQTTLDRIDPNGNYEKGNIRWATYKEQANNKRKSVTTMGDECNPVTYR